MLLKLLTILKKETEIMEKLIKYSISNLQLRILSTLFLILPLIFITWYNYIGSIIILFFVSCLSTRELINKKLTLTYVITCLTSGFIAISPFVIYEIFNTNIYFKNFIFYLISLIIILSISLPIIFNKQNIISNKFYKLIFPILLPSILMIYGSIILIENKNVFLLLMLQELPLKYPNHIQVHDSKNQQEYYLFLRILQNLELLKSNQQSPFFL